MRRGAFAWVCVIATVSAASPGCVQIAGLGKPCEAACASPTSRLVCNDDGTAEEEACPVATEPCMKSSCSAGQCTAPHFALGLACGEDGLGVCHEGGACLGPGMHLSAIRDHACALLHDKSVWCWGQNDFSELGDGTTTFRDRPVRVQQLGRAIAIGLGYVHACAIIEDGSVWCWGNNQGAQCGLPSGSPQPFPQKVTGLGNLRFTSVSGGLAHTCALSEQGDVYCWGDNQQGECGVDPTLPNINAMVIAPSQTSIVSSVTRLDSIKEQNCVIRAADPRFECWGSNVRGELALPLQSGKTGVAYSFTPVPIVMPMIPGDPPDSNTVQTFGLGYDSTYAVTIGSSLYAWGYNSRGQLGTGNKALLDPTPALVLLQGVVNSPALHAIAVYRSDGSDQCAKVEHPETLDGSSFACWGGNDHGELGYGTTSTLGQELYEAAPSPAIPNDSIELVRGEDFGCSIDPGAANTPPGEANLVKCWGAAQYTGVGINGKDPDSNLQPQRDAKPVWASVPSP